jgi:hypothetical protein
MRLRARLPIIRSTWGAWLLSCAALAASAAPTAPADLTADARAGALVDSERHEALRRAAPDLNGRVLSLALTASECARRAELAADARYLAVIDYSLPSTAKRFWLFDLEEARLLTSELVAHGANTGETHARRFSNREGSHQSSLGLFRTAETYRGKHGYSLRLDGLERGINDRARERAIVMHGASYVSEDFAGQHGRIGRSWGCPALSLAASSGVIDRIQGGNLLFSYYPDETWLESSQFLNCTERRAATRGSEAFAASAR